MPSTFPTAVDTFVTHYDPPNHMLGTIARYEQLRSKADKTPVETQEYEQLATSLAPYIFTSEELNTIQEAMVNLESYFLNNTVKQLDTWKKEIDTHLIERVTSFAYKGVYSPTATYLKENVVRYQNQLYSLKTDTATGVLPTDEINWTLIMPNQKGDKGDKGDPGSNLFYKGNWETGREYVIDDLVSYGGQLYRVAAAHTSAETFEVAKFEMVMNVNNLDMEVLACKLGYSYRAHDINHVVTEKIVSGLDKSNPFGDRTGETEVLKCVSTYTKEEIGDKITQVYTDPNHFFDKRDTYTIVTIVSNTNEMVTYEQ